MSAVILIEIIKRIPVYYVHIFFLQREMIELSFTYFFPLLWPTPKSVFLFQTSTKGIKDLKTHTKLDVSILWFSVDFSLSSAFYNLFLPLKLLSQQRIKLQSFFFLNTFLCNQCNKFRTLLFLFIRIYN